MIEIPIHEINEKTVWLFIIVNWILFEICDWGMSGFALGSFL